MSYSVMHNKKDKKFEIVERDTQNVITSKKSEKEARNTCRKLNLGSGFNGFTPSFFLKTYIS